MSKKEVTIPASISLRFKHDNLVIMEVNFDADEAPRGYDKVPQEIKDVVEAIISYNVRQLSICMSPDRDRCCRVIMLYNIPICPVFKCDPIYMDDLVEAVANLRREMAKVKPVE